MTDPTPPRKWREPTKKVKTMMREIDPVKYAQHLEPGEALPVTQSPMPPDTNEGPPSWWRAGESPVYCAIPPERGPMTRQDMIDWLNAQDEGYRMFSTIADEMEAMLAEIEELKKYDRRPYFREIQNRSRQKKRGVK